MIDIHCHILPETDDGAKDLEESRAMAQMLAEDGVTHVVATPHCHPMRWRYRDEIAPRVTALNAHLRAQDIPVTILPGSEIQLQTVEKYQDDYQANRYFHLGEGREYSLIEFPWNERNVPSGTIELMRWLRERETQPIIAHPERTPYFQNDVAGLQELVDAGAWIQLTTDSLTGAHGAGAQRLSHAMAREYSGVCVLATDAHGVWRCSGFAEAFECLRELCGAAAEADVRARMETIQSRIAPAG